MLMHYFLATCIFFLFFSSKNDVWIDLQRLNDHPQQLAARLLNISEGGVGLSLQKDAASTPLYKGENLIISVINNRKELSFILKSKIEVKWIFTNPTLKHIGIGCEFKHLSQDVQKKLTTFVNSLLKD